MKQDTNSPYFKFVKGESEAFYQAVLLLPEEKHSLCWSLFALWSELTPFAFWRSSDIPNQYLQNWKEKVFFGDSVSGNDSVPTIAQEAWIVLKEHFMPTPRQFFLDLLNGLEAGAGTMRFPSFKDLEVYLKMVGGSIALISAKIVFADEIEDGTIEFLEPIYYFGAGMLWWKLLQNTASLVEEGKLFIPLEDLQAFDCTEEDLLAQLKSPKIEELTKFELQKVTESLKFAKKNANYYPKGLKEALTFLSNYYSEEISSAIRSGWLLSSKEAFSKKPAKSGWFINSFTRFQKKNPVR